MLIPGGPAPGEGGNPGPARRRRRPEAPAAAWRLRPPAFRQLPVYGSFRRRIVSKGCLKRVLGVSSGCPQGVLGVSSECPEPARPCPVTNPFLPVSVPILSRPCPAHPTPTKKRIPPDPSGARIVQTDAQPPENRKKENPADLPIFTYFRRISVDSANNIW